MSKAVFWKSIWTCLRFESFFLLVNTIQFCYIPFFPPISFLSPPSSFIFFKSWREKRRSLCFIQPQTSRNLLSAPKAKTIHSCWPVCLWQYTYYALRLPVDPVSCHSLSAYLKQQHLISKYVLAVLCAANNGDKITSCPEQQCVCWLAFAASFLLWNLSIICLVFLLPNSCFFLLTEIA